MNPSQPNIYSPLSLLPSLHIVLLLLLLLAVLDLSMGKKKLYVLKIKSTKQIILDAQLTTDFLGS